MRKYSTRLKLLIIQFFFLKCLIKISIKDDEVQCDQISKAFNTKLRSDFFQNLVKAAKTILESS